MLQIVISVNEQKQIAFGANQPCDQAYLVGVLEVVKAMVIKQATGPAPKVLMPDGSTPPSAN